MASSSSPHRSAPGFLLLAPLVGLLALAFGLFAYADAGLVASQPGEHSLVRWVNTAFDVAALLALGERADHPGGHWAFATARLLALAFVALGATGIVFELSASVRDAFRRVRLTLERLAGRRPVTVVGLGWIGEPLAVALRRAGRPVTALALDDSTPRARRASEEGVLVVAGDATDPEVLEKAGGWRADEVFIATGDDGRNIDIAGKLLGPRPIPRRGWLGAVSGWPVRVAAEARERAMGAVRRFRAVLAGLSGAALRLDVPPLPHLVDLVARRLGQSYDDARRCYIHLGDPSFSLVLQRHELLKDESEEVRFHLFSNPGLAAKDLLIREGTGLLQRHAPVAGGVPHAVPHLFLFGFGEVGREVARHVARFAHFGSEVRPRLTVYGDVGHPAGRDVSFLARHPAFTAEGLDLTRPEFHGGGGDGWDARPGRPAAPEYRKGEVVLRGRRVRPVEYAVNAEFRRLDVLRADTSELVEHMAERMMPVTGRPVRAAAVFCFDEERTSFHAALELQIALVRRLGDRLPERTDEAGALCPIYIYLPVEKGFGELLEERARRREDGDGEGGDELWRTMDEHFPIRPFGDQESVNAYESVTGQGIRRHAPGLRIVHRILARRTTEYHPDFDSSDFDAVLHGLYVKAPTLGIDFVARDVLDRGEHLPILESLWSEEVTRAHEALPRRKDGKVVLSPDEFAGRDACLRQRLALLDAVHVSEQTPIELRRLLEKATRRAVLAFENELDERGLDPCLPSRMEHHRYLGERLTKGWQFGERSGPGRRRLSIIPWEPLTRRDKWYNRAQLPKILLEKTLTGVVPVMYRAGPSGSRDPTDENATS